MHGNWVNIFLIAPFMTVGLLFLCVMWSCPETRGGLYCWCCPACCCQGADGKGSPHDVVVCFHGHCFKTTREPEPGCICREGRCCPESDWGICPGDDAPVGEGDDV